MTQVASTMEHDAVHLHSTGGRVEPGDIAIGVIIGRTSEFFDFFVYAIASVVVFPKLLFPSVDPLTGTLYSFAIFALAFIARPFGTAFFLAVDRNQGRAAKLTGALFLLGTSTVAIAFLPRAAISASMRYGCCVLPASSRVSPGAARGMASPRCWP